MQNAAIWTATHQGHRTMANGVQSRLSPSVGWLAALRVAVVCFSLLAVLPFAALPQEREASTQRASESSVGTAPWSDQPAWSPDRLQESSVPYAVLAEAFLSRVARQLASRPDDTWASSRGLDPVSESARELVRLALELEEYHPRRLNAEEREEILERFAGDGQGLERWADERRSARFRAAGALWGRWLGARRREGYPAELLIERLLSRDAAALARLTIEVGGGQPAPPLRDFRNEALAFEEGVREAMVEVPARFRAGAKAEL